VKRQFLGVLWKELKARGIRENKVHLPLVVDQFDSLLETNSIEPSSKAAREHLERACLMLAAYRVLESHVDRVVLLEVLKAALCDPNSWVIRNSTRALLFFSLIQ